MTRELDAKVAEALGWDVSSFSNVSRWVALLGVDTMRTVRTVPRFSTDIAAAWKLGGDDWKWRFEEYVYLSKDKFEMRLDVTLWLDGNFYAETLCFDEFTTKAEAYANGRCLVFLQVKKED